MRWLKRAADRTLAHALDRAVYFPDLHVLWEASLPLCTVPIEIFPEIIGKTGWSDPA